MHKPHILLLTSGGDAPGMNTFLAKSIHLLRTKYTVYLCHNGLNGLIKNQIEPVNEHADYLQFLNQPSTFLGSSRLQKPLQEDAVSLAAIIKNLQHYQIAHLIILGGNGSMGAADVISLASRVNIINVPFSIDNDLREQFYTIGSLSAALFNQSLLNNLKYTNQAHNALCFVEIMGRNHPYLLEESIVDLNPLLTIKSVPEKLTPQVICDKIAAKLASKQKYDPLIVVKELIYQPHEYDQINELIKQTFPEIIVRRPIFFSYLQRGCDVAKIDQMICLNAVEKLFDFLNNFTFDNPINNFFVAINQNNKDDIKILPYQILKQKPQQ
ncbi:6-phosphofructokinase [Ureaplasma miroungigenitalium]|uniref:6-phosphofructokinase n=1 Tax=Ureaplasma miroungigenitalium TaxID=1042321 RepID=A0ABT3BMZ2_9BACT|nr:6-phosphofructokinase [Ureaplasma miroungigenitalium]MCV3728597.1 6-phosphofructokinase [Ureaplasma miroungigenitalium]MCV3734396.1 6-phosphofructokinase [Ureaplasma miroungigenitalium]